MGCNIAGGIAFDHQSSPSPERNSLPFDICIKEIGGNPVLEHIFYFLQRTYTLPTFYNSSHLRFASLDLGLLATSFCLLRLPKMPDLKDVLQRHGGRLPRFVPAGREVDIFAIPFRDKIREEARQKRLQQELAAGGKNAKLLRAERKQAEKERKIRERREAALAKGRNPDKKRSRHAQLADEWDDLAKEERLHKKLRRGKITKEQFEDEMCGNA